MLFFVCLYGLVWFGLFFIPYHLRQCGYCLNLTSLTETARSTFSLRSHFSSHTVKGYKEGSWQVSERSTLWQTLNLFLFCLWMETISDFFFVVVCLFQWNCVQRDKSESSLHLPLTQLKKSSCLPTTWHPPVQSCHCETWPADISTTDRCGDSWY